MATKISLLASLLWEHFKPAELYHMCTVNDVEASDHENGLDAVESKTSSPTLPDAKSLTNTTEFAVELSEDAVAFIEKHFSASTFKGMCYFEGYGVRKNVELAYPLFLSAAMNANGKVGQDVVAIYYLALCRDFGYGCVQSLHAATQLRKALFSLLELLQVQLLTSSSYPHWVSGVVHLYAAYCHANGYGTDESGFDALESFRKSASFGNHAAMYEVGASLEDGVNIRGKVKSNVALALPWYRRAASYYNVEALSALVRLTKSHSKLVLESADDVANLDFDDVPIQGQSPSVTTFARTDDDNTGMQEDTFY